VPPSPANPFRKISFAAPPLGTPFDFLKDEPRVRLMFSENPREKISVFLSKRTSLLPVVCRSGDFFRHSIGVGRELIVVGVIARFAQNCTLTPHPDDHCLWSRLKEDS
jgi:hypothetical protein